jgi:spermidine/putrescine transport system substrate-binding protein
VRRTLPDDPIVRTLVQRARGAQLTRRALLGGAAGSAAALALAACASPLPAAAPDQSAVDKRLTWATWPLYLDTDESGKHPTLEAFTKKTGIAVDYREIIQDNNQYNASVRTKLAAGQDIGADTAILTDWMASRWVRFGYTQELDHSRMPNLKNLNPKLLDVDYDKGRTHSVPWQGGFAGIAWNSEQFPKGFRTVTELFAEPGLKGRIEVLSEWRDTVGLLMLEQGVDIAKDFSDTAFETALDVIQKNITLGVIRGVKGNAYTDDLVSGDALAAICWSGDIESINAQHGGKWTFAIPDAGGTLWNDNFLVPLGARHKQDVEALIDFYYDPQIAAQVAAYVNYITPVVGAREEAAKIDPKLADDNWIFPDDATLASAHVFRTLTPAADQAYSSAFQKVLLAA